MPSSSHSVRSKSSNHSSRAVSILDQIKTQTSPKVYKDFLAEVALFRQQKIDAADLQRRINNILIDYPLLLKQFQTTLPSTPNQKFKSALLFVNKVKEAYISEPTVYQEFLNFMKEFQRGGYERDYVTEKVAELLKDQPELVKEFSEFYQPENRIREKKHSEESMLTIKASDSNATLRAADFGYTDSSPSVDQPVLEQDEGLEIANESTPLLGDVEAQSQLIVNNTKFYAIVGSFATFVAVGTGLSYAMINGYITW